MKYKMNITVHSALPLGMRKLSEVVWRFEWEMFLIGSYVWTLGPQLVVLFGKVLGPLVGRALLEEIHQCVYSLVPLPILSYCFLCVNVMWLASFLLPQPDAKPYPSIWIILGDFCNINISIFPQKFSFSTCDVRVCNLPLKDCTVLTAWVWCSW